MIEIFYFRVSKFPKHKPKTNHGIKIDGGKNLFDTISAIKSCKKNNKLKFRWYNNFM